MRITEIKIRRLYNENRLRAIVSITIDNELAIHDIKVIEGPTRLFVAMPSKKEESGVFRDVVHPISMDTRREIETMIIDEYQRYVDQYQPELLSEKEPTSTPTTLYSTLEEQDNSF